MTSGAAGRPRFEVKRRVQHSSPEVRRPPLPTTTNGQERDHGGHGTADDDPHAGTQGIAASAAARPARRHPLVATAMVLPLAALLVVVFGGWEAVVTQASSVGVMLGR